jgi:N-acetylglucosaminyl-diphospho-decaprenol L-rhamnosyltransferase
MVNDHRRLIMISRSRVPIIIVGYGNPEDIVKCLEALQGLAVDPAFQVYVCENAGPAAFDSLISALTAINGPCDRAAPMEILTEQMLRFVRVQCLRFRRRDAQVLVAEATENFGYAGAVNAWLRALLPNSSWPGVWILNPDTQPEPRALAELAACSTGRRKGMVGSRLVLFTEPNKIRSQGLQWEPIRASTLAIGLETPIALEPNIEEVEAKLDAASGASMFVTRKCLERIGLMDERYFLYFEDLDWGVRAKDTYGIGYAHDSIVRHHGGTTIGSARSRTNASPFSVYLEFRNRLLFVRWRRPLWIFWTILVLFIRAFEYGMAGAFVNMRAAFAGLNAAISGETGRPDRLFEFGAGPPSLRSRRTSGSPDSVLRDPGRIRSGLARAQRVFAEATKRKLKIGISFIVYLLTKIRDGLRKALGRSDRHRIVILYYHSLPSKFRANFGRQLDMIAARWNVVPADYSGPALGGHSVAITFDDAYTSVLDNAIPELLARRMPATIFVPVGALGRSPGWDMEEGCADSGEIVASADALRSVTSDLVQLGAHSLTHPHLPCVSVEEARVEIHGCREQMRNVIGIDPAVFAFPYGECDASAVELCREAGYQWAFNNVPGLVDPASSEFVRGRVQADVSDGPLEFYLKSAGAYSWMRYFSGGKRYLRRRRSEAPK